MLVGHQRLPDWLLGPEAPETAEAAREVRGFLRRQVAAPYGLHRLAAHAGNDAPSQERAIAILGLFQR